MTITSLEPRYRIPCRCVVCGEIQSVGVKTRATDRGYELIPYAALQGDKEWCGDCPRCEAVESLVLLDWKGWPYIGMRWPARLWYWMRSKVMQRVRPWDA